MGTYIYFSVAGYILPCLKRLAIEVLCLLVSVERLKPISLKNNSD